MVLLEVFSDELGVQNSAIKVLEQVVGLGSQRPNDRAHTVDGRGGHNHKLSIREEKKRKDDDANKSTLPRKTERGSEGAREREQHAHTYIPGWVILQIYTQITPSYPALSTMHTSSPGRSCVCASSIQQLLDFRAER